MAAAMQSIVRNFKGIIYGFCTESMVTGENIDQLKLRKELESYGDSLIVAGSTEKTKVHIHINNRENVIYLGLSEALSGTINSARSTASTLNYRDRIRIINSRNLSVAYALLARRAGEAIAEGATVTEVADLLNELIPRTRLYAAVPTLDSLIKSGRVSKMKGIIANLFNLKPLITIDSEGNAEKRKS